MSPGIHVPSRRFIVQHSVHLPDAAFPCLGHQRCFHAMQGQVAGSQGTYIDICCDMVDLLSSSSHSAACLLSTLAAGLSPSPTAGSTSGSNKRGKGGRAASAQHKQAACKQGTAMERVANAPCGGVLGALALTAMLLRHPGCGADEALHSHTKLPDLHQGLVAAMVAIAADPHADGAATDLQLTVRLAILSSALAHASPDPTAAEAHADHAHAHAVACAAVTAALPLQPPQQQHQQQEHLLEAAVALAEAAEAPSDAPVKRRRTAPAAAGMAVAALAAANTAVVDLAMATNVLLDAFCDAPGREKIQQQAEEAVVSLWGGLQHLSQRFLAVCMAASSVSMQDGVKSLERTLVASVVTMADSMEALCRGVVS
jgi:LmbE family N-acetylglucosaminyl deacetylase